MKMRLIGQEFKCKERLGLHATVMVLEPYKGLQESVYILSTQAPTIEVLPSTIPIGKRCYCIYNWSD